jgi:hypothetical protein
MVKLKKQQINQLLENELFRTIQWHLKTFACGSDRMQNFYKNQEMAIG